jgi:uncharacterized membrane protein YfcA
MTYAVPAANALSHPFWVFEWELIWHPQVLVCSIFLFFSAILCSAAGIGGGGIYVAVLMVAGKLTPHNAVPLSKAVVFPGAVASLIVNLFYMLRGTQAQGTKSVINTDACRLVVPATLIGTYVGVLVNRYTSDYIIVVLLVIVLIGMTGSVIRIARQQALKEQNPGEEEVTNGQASSEDTPLLNQQGNQPSQADGNLLIIPAATKQAPSSYDVWTAGVLLAVVVIGGILRFHMQLCKAEVLGDGTKGGACKHPVLGLFYGHMEKWMGDATTSMILSQMVWTVPIWACVFLCVQTGFVANQVVGWRPRSVILYQLVAFMTGLLAGLVGVGGGLIFSPFFLLTGMDPAMAVGTSATCVLFTSSSTTMQYIFTDRIIMSLALVYGLVTLVASFIGTLLVHYIQDRFDGRKSYITAIVAVGVGISAVLSVVKFVYLISETPQEPVKGF